MQTEDVTGTRTADLRIQRNDAIGWHYIRRDQGLARAIGNQEMGVPIGGGGGGVSPLPNDVLSEGEDTLLYTASPHEQGGDVPTSPPNPPKLKREKRLEVCAKVGDEEGRALDFGGHSPVRNTPGKGMPATSPVATDYSGQPRSVEPESDQRSSERVGQHREVGPSGPHEIVRAGTTGPFGQELQGSDANGIWTANIQYVPHRHAKGDKTGKHGGVLVGIRDNQRRLCLRRSLRLQEQVVRQSKHLGVHKHDAGHGDAEQGSVAFLGSGGRVPREVRGTCDCGRPYFFEPSSDGANCCHCEVRPAKQEEPYPIDHDKYVKAKNKPDRKILTDEDAEANRWNKHVATAIEERKQEKRYMRLSKIRKEKCTLAWNSHCWVPGCRHDGTS